MTASALYLSASEFYDQSLSFVDGMPDTSVLLPTFRDHRAAWDDFVATSRGRHLPVPVPYEGAAMPGYLFRPDASGVARPTLVVTNGSDGALSGLWATAIRPALDRGWNAFVFDGPGQQSMLFERDIPFRHDWEAVLTPVVDVLVDRADVDASALLAYAISQGGYWLPRALAFEHRFVAAVADGGVVDVARAWNVNLPPALLALLRAGDRDTVQRRDRRGPGGSCSRARIRLPRQAVRRRDALRHFRRRAALHAARRHRLDHDAAADPRPRGRAVLPGPAAGALRPAARREGDRAVHPRAGGELPLPAARPRD